MHRGLLSSHLWSFPAPRSVAKARGLLIPRSGPQGTPATNHHLHHRYHYHQAQRQSQVEVMGSEGANMTAGGTDAISLEEQAVGEGRRGNRSGQGGRKGGRGGAGRGGQGRDVQISRALSKLLRHQAESAGIKLDTEGYAPLDRVLAWGPLRSLGVTLAEIQSIVATNDKQRYALKPNPPSLPGVGGGGASAADYLIRANQGHSIKLESSSLLQPVSPAEGNVPPRVLHGTYYAFWPAILRSGGLRPMGRNHVHCSTGTPEEADAGVISGMRRDAELLIEIDVERSIVEGGLTWWRSENGVLLTEGNEEGLLSTQFFKRVEGRGGAIGVLWEDGVKVADLPESLKARAPPGKGRGGRGNKRP